MAPGVFSLGPSYVSLDIQRALSKQEYSFGKKMMMDRGRRTDERRQINQRVNRKYDVCIYLSSVLFMALGNTLYLLRSPINYIGRGDGYRQPSHVHRPELLYGVSSQLDATLGSEVPRRQPCVCSRHRVGAVIGAPYLPQKGNTHLLRVRHGER
jgi:hypothetical protein